LKWPKFGIHPRRDDQDRNREGEKLLELTRAAEVQYLQIFLFAAPSFCVQVLEEFDWDEHRDSRVQLLDPGELCGCMSRPGAVGEADSSPKGWQDS
jgi:hypothetical protein